MTPTRGRLFGGGQYLDRKVAAAQVEEEGNYAVPHGLTLEGTFAPLPLDSERSLSVMAPAGGLWSTANDMGRYLVTQLNDGVAPDGTRVVSAANLAVTREPQVAVDANTQYALGWMIADFNGQPLVNHAGDTQGFSSKMTFLPEAGLGIIVLTNAKYTDAFNDGVAYRVYELLFGLAPQAQAYLDSQIARLAAQKAEHKPQARTAIDAETLAPYVGVFTNEALGEIVVRLEGNTLTLDAGAFETRLLPAYDGEGSLLGYLQVDPPAPGTLYQFVRDDVGWPAIILAVDSDNQYTFQKAD